MPTRIADITPPWLNPANASVLDSSIVRVLRALVNANPLPEALESVLPNPNPLSILRDPQGQVMGLATTHVPTGSLANVVKRLADAPKRVPNPIKAYHGSPHDFDQFSMEKIGTGEGAQAYGHGLYFAENPRVARDYKRATFDRHVGNHQTGLNDAMIGNEPARFTDFDGNVKRLTSAGAPDDVARTVADYVSVLSESEKPLTSHLVAKALRNQQFATPATRKAADWLKANPDVIRHKGKMYEVNIHADPESFLDWDKPLSQQSEAVRKAAEKFGITHDRDASRQFTDALADALGGGGSTTLPKQPADPMGSDLYSRLPIPDRTKSAVSERLRAEGIPGIKYLDQGSRAAGEGSRNYVVFDDSLIEILRKYGLLPFAAGLGARADEQ